jgi:DNA-binding NtrC family response regulator
MPLFEKRVSKISNGYLDRLMAHDWPGNVRELRNAIQFSMARLSGESLLPEHLDHFFHQRPIAKTTAPEMAQKSRKLSEVTQQLILDVIKDQKGNKAGAARSLGISRATLYRKIKMID